MSFCPNCGNQIEDNSTFCRHCGHNQRHDSTAVSQQPRNGRKQMHCPKCKSTSFSPIVESDVSGGSTTSLSISKRVSVGQVHLKNTHRNYWLCSNCGEKFRNIQNLDEEIMELSKKQKIVLIGCIAAVCFMIIAPLTLKYDYERTPIRNLFLMFAAGFGIWFAYLRNKIGQLNKEKDYLKKHCFD